MTIRERKAAAMEAILAAHERFYGEKPPTPEQLDYRRYVLDVLAHSPSVRVYLEREAAATDYKPFNGMDELNKLYDELKLNA